MKSHSRLLSLVDKLLILVIVVAFILFHNDAASAQTDEITWSTPINLSNTPDNTSTDPFLLSDPAGYIHLFWAEKTGPDEGQAADTLMYSRWDGESWTQPIDLFYVSPDGDNHSLVYPRGVMDESGDRKAS